MILLLQLLGMLLGMVAGLPMYLSARLFESLGLSEDEYGILPTIVCAVIWLSIGVAIGAAR